MVDLATMATRTPRQPCMCVWVVSALNLVSQSHNLSLETALRNPLICGIYRSPSYSSSIALKNCNIYRTWQSRVRTPPARVGRGTHKLMPLLTHPLASFRLQVIPDMQELVMEVLEGRCRLQWIAIWGMQRAKTRHMRVND